MPKCAPVHTFTHLVASQGSGTSKASPRYHVCTRAESPGSRGSDNLTRGIRGDRMPGCRGTAPRHATEQSLGVAGGRATEQPQRLPLCGSVGQVARPTDARGGGGHRAGAPRPAAHRAPEPSPQRGHRGAGRKESHGTADRRSGFRESGGTVLWSQPHNLSIQFSAMTGASGASVNSVNDKPCFTWNTLVTCRESPIGVASDPRQQPEFPPSRLVR